MLKAARLRRKLAPDDFKALWKASKRHDAELVRRLLLEAVSTGRALQVLSAFHPRKGLTLLMIACHKRDRDHKRSTRDAVQTVQALVEFGADTSAKSLDRDGNTALHFAAASNQPRTVEFLLQIGASAQALNANGHTAFDLARYHKSRDVVDVFLQRENRELAALQQTLASSGSAASPEDAERRSECLICMDAARDAVCTPCGHVVGCFACLSRHAQSRRRCPMCNAHVDAVLKIYDC